MPSELTAVDMEQFPTQDREMQYVENQRNQIRVARNAIQEEEEEEEDELDEAEDDHLIHPAGK